MVDAKTRLYLAIVLIEGTTPTRQSKSNLTSGKDFAAKSLCPVNVSLSSNEEGKTAHSIDATQSSKSSSSGFSFSDADDSPGSD